jgi:transposase InsO family protein
MAIPQGVNQRWSLDFVSDALACGRKFRILTVVDDFSRECLALSSTTRSPAFVPHVSSIGSSRTAADRA